MRFGEYALQRGWVSEGELSDALAVQQETKERLGTLLVRMGVLSRRQRMDLLSLQTGLSFEERLGRAYSLLENPFGQRTKTYVYRRRVMHALRRRLDPTLRSSVARNKPRVWSRVAGIAIPDPADLETIRNLRIWAPKAVLRFYDFSPQATGKQSTLPTEQAEGGISSPLVDWLDESLAEGIRLGASDLHFVQESGVMVLRYRVHGRFRMGPQVPAAYQNGLVPRIKVMAGMDVAEERLPQDGSFERRLSGTRFDFRVSVLPGLEREGVVIRILGGGGQAERIALGLDELEMPSKLLEVLRAWAHRRAGIILITGPTGSGKTSTLYALLRELDRSQAKIITLEDPVEYALDGAHQVQVNPEIGLSFAQGLRAILRHDPDIILVGEIRDRETAEIALRASLTGHLVLSTLHTNSAVGAFTRLHDMGIPPYLTADAVLGVLAQRLVGRTCRTCGAFDPGCPICLGSGIDGRIALFEGGPADVLRECIRTNAPEDEMKSILLALGFPSLAQDGRDKVATGLVPERELKSMGLWETA